MLIPHSNKPLIISCDYYSGTGYATLSRGFLRILDKNGIDFRVLPEPELFKRCTTSEEDEYFDSFIIKPEERHWIADNNYVYFRIYPPRENPKRLFNVGFTMVEAYSVNPNHVNLINNSFDLVLVPSYFVKNVFSRYMDPEKIKVVPLGVDQDIFNPTVEAVNFPTKFKKVDISSQKLISTDEQPGDVFKFSSSGVFNHRKGYDLVLKSFVKTFTKNDDVALLLFCQPENPFEPYRMENRIFQILNETNTSQMPPIFICDEPWSTNEQAKPYAHGDCFVFPSRGEGFGLPVIEAGACGIPVICPNHTGLGDFVNNSNSFVIDVDKIDNIGEIGEQYNVDTYIGKYPEWTRDMFHHQTRNCYFPIMNSDRVLDQICDYMKYVYGNSRSNTVKVKQQNMYNLIQAKYTWSKVSHHLVSTFKGE